MFYKIVENHKMITFYFFFFTRSFSSFNLWWLCHRCQAQLNVFNTHRWWVRSWETTCTCNSCGCQHHFFWNLGKDNLLIKLFFSNTKFKLYFFLFFFHFFLFFCCFQWLQHCVRCSPCIGQNFNIPNLSQINILILYYYFCLIKQFIFNYLHIPIDQSFIRLHFFVFI